MIERIPEGIPEKKREGAVRNPSHALRKDKPEGTFTETVCSPANPNASGCDAYLYYTPTWTFCKGEKRGTHYPVA